MPPEKAPETHQEMLSMSHTQVAQILRYASDAVLPLFSSYISIYLFFIYSSGAILLSAEAPVNKNTVTVDLDNGGKQLAIIAMTDDKNPKNH